MEHKAPPTLDLLWPLFMVVLRLFLTALHLNVDSEPWLKNPNEESTPIRRRWSIINPPACRSAATKLESSRCAPNAPLTWWRVTHTRRQSGGFRGFFAGFGQIGNQGCGWRKKESQKLLRWRRVTHTRHPSTAVLMGMVRVPP